MNIVFSSGWTECFWENWPWSKQYGGSEKMLVEVACEMAAAGHTVTVRLPYEREAVDFRGVHWVGLPHPSLRSDVLFCFDDYERRDSGSRTLLVATRSDPPRHADFDELIFLSRTHARLMGHASRPAIGGGVRLSEYAEALARIPNRVIYTSSPDRGGHHAAVIGKDYDYVATYRGMNELDHDALVRLQKSAMVQIHPYDSPRESEFFCMSALEALAAGTPTILSNGPALEELWGEAAIILPRPIDYGQWSEVISELLDDKATWAEFSGAGKRLAQQYDWPLVAQKYLDTALEVKHG